MWPQSDCDAEAFGVHADVELTAALRVEGIRTVTEDYDQPPQPISENAERPRGRAGAHESIL